MQRYIASSQLSINVRLKSGSSLHIRFSPLTGGTSVFYTDDKDIQKALESHPKFNRLFEIDKYYVDKPTVTEKNDKPSAGEEGSGLKKVKVACADDAKDYMAEKFGTSRTQMRSIAGIRAAAAEKGIEFEGLE